PNASATPPTQTTHWVPKRSSRLRTGAAGVRGGAVGEEAAMAGLVGSRGGAAAFACAGVDTGTLVVGAAGSGADGAAAGGGSGARAPACRLPRRNSSARRRGSIKFSRLRAPTAMTTPAIAAAGIASRSATPNNAISIGTPRLRPNDSRKCYARAGSGGSSGALCERRTTHAVSSRESGLRIRANLTHFLSSRPSEARAGTQLSQHQGGEMGPGSPFGRPG